MAKDAAVREIRPWQAVRQGTSASREDVDSSVRGVNPRAVGRNARTPAPDSVTLLAPRTLARMLVCSLSSLDSQ